MNHIHLDDLAPGPAGVAILAEGTFTTPWQRFDLMQLAPGSGLAPDAEVDGCEDGFILLDGAVQLRDNGAHFGVASPAVVLMATASPAGIEAPEGARLLHVQVGLTGPMVATATRAEAVDADALNWRPAIHGGCGRIATRHIWGPGDFASTWTFLDHAVLEPGASVGYHYHDALEESFVVLGGRGRMTVADETFAVEPGSVTWQGIGQGHGIYNAAAEPLEFLRVAVAAPEAEYTTIDLHDDLAARLAAEEEQG